MNLRNVETLYSEISISLKQRYRNTNPLTTIRTSDKELGLSPSMVKEETAYFDKNSQGYFEMIKTHPNTKITEKH